MELGRVFVDDVFIGNRHRSLDSSRVESLAESIKAIGLQTPISVYVDGDDHAHLVAGLHRLEAARHLGWEFIDANFVKMDDVERELWEIAENLHRVELTKEQRDEHIRRYAELLEAREAAAKADEAISVQNGQKLPSRSVGRPKSTNGKIAEQFGISLNTVKRARGQIVDPPRVVEDEREARRNRAMAAWNKLDDEDRAWFRDWIDTPIMDVSYGA